MAFELDAQKSQSHLAKHGIDFAEAHRLWGDPDSLEIPARAEDEPRSIVIGKNEAKHWLAVITYRGEDIRIISVRRSR